MPTLSNNAEPLADGYHLENFSVLLRQVLALYQDLLTQEEINFIQQFFCLSESAQNLYVRLVMRKGPYFRNDNIRYDAIGDQLKTLQELDRYGYVNITNELPLDLLLNLCVKAELIDITRNTLKQPLKCSKCAIIERLLEEVPLSSLQKEVSQLFLAIERCHDKITRRLQLLFFGNTRQGLTEFITAQLGIIHYEDYPIDKHIRFFQTRQRLDLLEELSTLRDWQEQSLGGASADAIEEKLQQLISIHNVCKLEDAYLDAKVQRTITHLSRQLERLAPEQALVCYQHSIAPPSRERQARILEKQGENQKALDLIKVIEQSPQHPDESTKLTPLKKKLHKKLDLAPPSATHQETYKEKQLVLTPSNENIENLVAKAFTTGDNLCLHVENQLFLGLFGLHFWDIIFSPCSDAFYNPYQLGPRDLWEPQFYQKRKPFLDIRLAELENNNFPDNHSWRNRIQKHMFEKRNVANFFVNWQIMNEEVVGKICHCIPPQHLHAVFKKMLENLGYYRNGFPDLLLLSDDSYQLWEVKGPTDSLQNNQKRWLSFFKEHDIPAGVIYVTWQTE